MTTALQIHKNASRPRTSSNAATVRALMSDDAFTAAQHALGDGERAFVVTDAKRGVFVAVQLGETAVGVCEVAGGCPQLTHVNVWVAGRQRATSALT